MLEAGKKRCSGGGEQLIGAKEYCSNSQNVCCKFRIIAPPTSGSPKGSTRRDFCLA